MPQVAFLYPGQGSQRVGMGADLDGTYGRTFQELLDAAQHHTGLPIRSSLEGPADRLAATDIAQPAILAHSLALTEAVRDAGIHPGITAGHSLGEYSAASVAGCLDPLATMRVVCRRGQLMAAAHRARPGTMLAVFGLSATVVEEACASVVDAGVATISAFNAPDQLVVSLDLAAREPFTQAIAELDGDVMPLPVGAAFHSDLVRPVALEMAPVLAATTGSDPKLPIVSSTRAALVESWSELKAALIEQITAPVLWQQTLRVLRGRGFDTFVEIGPGRVLTGFVRKTLSGVRAISVADLAGVRVARQALADADA